MPEIVVVNAVHRLCALAAIDQERVHGVGFKDDNDGRASPLPRNLKLESVALHDSAAMCHDTVRF